MNIYNFVYNKNFILFVNILVPLFIIELNKWTKINFVLNARAHL
jgi:hypothetical protein